MTTGMMILIYSWSFSLLKTVLTYGSLLSLKTSVLIYSSFSREAAEMKSKSGIARRIAFYLLDQMMTFWVAHSEEQHQAVIMRCCARLGATRI
jgi:hypothetical protein